MEFDKNFILAIAKNKNITYQEAILLIDKCIKFTSAKLNISYAKIYSILLESEKNIGGLKGEKKCQSLTIDDCKMNNECVFFEGKCLNKYFPDSDIINKDPDSYVKGLSTEKLSELVKLASYLYYNFKDYGLSDNSFDALEYHLKKRLKLKGRLYEKIGAPPIERIRVKLPYFMGSLDKVKPGSKELYNFLEFSAKKNDIGNPYGIAWSLKLDGVSAMIVYKDFLPFKIYTRGDGNIGGDVSYLKDYIELPKTKLYSDLIVRGEFILLKKIWDSKYKSLYSNARSFVSGKVNSGYISPGIQDINFVAYQIIKIHPLSEEQIEPSRAFKILELENFKVVDNDTIENPTVFDLISLYKSKRETSTYSIDGLVISIDEVPNLLPKEMKSVVAFKMRLEEQIRQTKVINIEWNISRYGRYIPVVLYESVYIDGVRLHRASGHNAQHIRDWNLGIGSKIKVVRSGDVIPTIIDVDVNLEIEPIFPPLIPEWYWKGKDIILKDIEGNRNVQIQRILYFFKTIGVPRLGEKTVEKFYDTGLNTINKITNAIPSNFIKIKGIGQKTAVNIYTGIHDTMQHTRIDRFIPASSNLELGIGRKLIKILLRYYPMAIEDSEETIRKNLKKKGIPGFGPKRIENVAENIPKFLKFLYSLNKEDIEYAIQNEKRKLILIKDKGYNKQIQSKIFVFTGFFGKVDYDLEDEIYDNLGSVSSVVNSSIECVISANLMDISTKIIEAEKLKIPVYSIEEFVKKYNLKYKSYTKIEYKDIPLEPDNPD